MSLNARNDSKLWDKIRAGDHSAFQKLYDLYVDLLYTFGRQYIQDDELIKDCIHDVFLDIYKKREGLGTVLNVKHYLIVSVRNQLLKQIKSNTKLIQLDKHNFEKSEVSFEQTIISGEQDYEQKRKLAEAINQLSFKQRKGLYLRFNLSKEYEEIAEIMKISVPSCRTLIYRAIKELRTYF